MSVVSPANVVPDAYAVTRLFSNELRADRLLGARPSLARAWNATLMAVRSPTVVPDASSIVWTSFLRVWRAVVSAEFVEWLPPPPPGGGGPASLPRPGPGPGSPPFGPRPAVPASPPGPGGVT